MANNASSKKRARQTVIRTKRNRARKERLRLAIRKFNDALKAGKKEDAEKELTAAQRALDKAGTKGFMHRGTIARKKSRLALALNKMGA